MPNEGRQTFTHVYSAVPYALDATLIGAHICVTILAEQSMKMRALGQCCDVAEVTCCPTADRR